MCFSFLKIVLFNETDRIDRSETLHKLYLILTAIGAKPCSIIISSANTAVVAEVYIITTAANIIMTDIIPTGDPSRAGGTSYVMVLGGVVIVMVIGGRGGG